MSDFNPSQIFNSQNHNKKLLTVLDFYDIIERNAK